MREDDFMSTHLRDLEQYLAALHKQQNESDGFKIFQRDVEVGF